MQFSEFNESSVLTESGVIVLKEGIDHIESLPHDKFLDTIRNLSNFIISEKLDGSNLVFGFTEDGKLYSSRETKNGKRMFSASEYSDRAADNGFKSAHAALDEVKNELRSIIDLGEAVEVEILFGRQPNAIVYGSNYIAFLRMIPGDNKQVPNQDKVKDLGKLLKGKTVHPTVPITTTDDGIEIKTNDVKQTWKFETVSYVESHHFTKVDVEQELKDFEQWIEQTHEVGIKNGDLLTIKLTKIPKADRPAIKQAREDSIATANEKFKLPIKEKFLDKILRRMTPALRDVDVEGHEDLGIEGVVILNPQTLEQFKIVDKDVFTSINQFNHAIRNQIKFAVGKRPEFGKILKLPIEDDVFGDMLKRIERITKIEGMGKYANIKRVLRKLVGDSAEQTIENVVEKFAVKDLNDAKHQISDAVKEGITDLNASLDHYNKNWNEFNIKLQSGNTTKYSSEINKRTLMVFAEVRQELHEMMRAVQDASTLGDIVVALFGRQLRDIHQ